jgi:predicted double-glycine peptidase
MLVTIFGVALIYFAATQAVVVEDYPQGYVYYEHPTKQGPVEQRGITLKPVSEFKYHNVVRQAFDYSCGSAALTTVLNHYLGRQFEERQIMEGLLRFGETERIVERRGFSLLDMRRLATALGHPSGGFRAKMSDVAELEHPAIVPITYGGFKHFVVVREYRNGYVYVADPALGNLSFTSQKFQEVWAGKDDNGDLNESGVLFIVFPEDVEPLNDLQLTEYDMRMIDDRTINRLAFQEFMVFTPRLEQQTDKVMSLVRQQIVDDEGVERIINVPTRTYFKN